MTPNPCQENAAVANITNLDPTIQKLINEAIKAREFAYCPYSNFKVGAAVLCEDGSIYSGCNIENSSFTVGTCAERCAYSKAISEGKHKFKAVAVIGQQEKSFTTPCGACRQFMSEFSYVDIYIGKPKGDSILVSSSEELLPKSFKTENYKFV